MRPLLVLPLLFTLTTAAFAQQGFQVLEISPASGPVTGGTQVTIRMNDLPNCPILPPAPFFLFGGVGVQGTYGPGNAFTVTTPPHTAGEVDVVVSACGMDDLIVPKGFTYLHDLDAEYEKVLLPVFYVGPGARGAQWGAKLSVHNSGDQPVTGANTVFSGDPVCLAVCGCGTTATIEAGAAAEVCTVFTDPAGMLFYAPRNASEDLHYSARAFDTSRSSANAGTEIRTVREREFRTGEIVLRDLPLDPMFRVALRVYNPDQVDHAQVRVRVFADGVGTIGQRVVTLSYPIQTLVPDAYPLRPSFAYVGDFDAIVREMLSVAHLTAPVTSFHVELAPVTAGIRYWAFASISNNDTQLITTVTPQY